MSQREQCKRWMKLWGPQDGQGFWLRVQEGFGAGVVVWGARPLQIHGRQLGQQSTGRR